MRCNAELSLVLLERGEIVVEGRMLEGEGELLGRLFRGHKRMSNAFEVLLSPLDVMIKALVRPHCKRVG